MTAISQRRGLAPGADVLGPGGTAQDRSPLGTLLIATGYAVFALLIGLWIGGGQPDAEVSGLPTAGPLVAWSVPLVQLARDVLATVTLGVLLTGAVLAPPAADRSGSLSDIGTRCLRAASWWALAWALFAGASLLLSLADGLAVPLPGLAAVDGLGDLAWSLASTRALVVVTLVAAAVAVAARRVRGAGGAVALLVAAGFGLLPPVYSGHASSAEDHTIAISALLLHVVAAAVWVGGLVGIAAHLRGGARDVLADAVSRFSRIALAAFAVTAISGVAGAWVRIGSAAELWRSPYGWLLVGKILVLVALGYFGWRHRQATIPALRDGAPWAFLRLAATEITVMAAAMGLAVALARSAPPVVAAGEVSPARLLLGYEVPPLSAAQLLAQWRPDPLLLLAILAAGLGYAAGLRRLRGRGAAWPLRRSVAWFAGLGALALALTGGVAAYAPTMISIGVVQHLLLAVAGPILLVCGAPRALLAAATSPAVRPEHPGGSGQSGALGEREPGEPGAHGAIGDGERSRDGWSEGLRFWSRHLGLDRLAAVLRHPAVLVPVNVAPPFFYYGTGLLAESQESHALHLLAVAVFTASGLLFFGVLLDPRTPTRVRAALTATAAAAYTGVAVLLAAGPAVAPDWYLSLRLVWAHPTLADQRLGAALWATAAVLLIGAIIARPAVRRALRARTPAQVPTP